MTLSQFVSLHKANKVLNIDLVVDTDYDYIDPFLRITVSDMDGVAEINLGKDDIEDLRDFFNDVLIELERHEV